MSVDKAFVSNAFGKHSRKVWRALVGATWSLPFRYITFGAQLSALKMVPGVVIEIPLGWLMVAGMTLGVMVGWSIRVMDNLINEFLVFKWIKQFFKEQKEFHGGA